MCIAANLSGEAISISKTTAPHAVSYPFTALYNVSHGHAVSLTLNKFLKFNYKNLASAKCNFDLNSRFKTLFDLTKTNSFEAFDQYLVNLKNNAKLENNFEKLGIDINKNYTKIISSVNSKRLANNPVDLNLVDLKKIIQS
jgi:alcohol dehydrogenase class IV